MSTEQPTYISYLPLSHVIAMKGDIFSSLDNNVFITFADEKALETTLEGIIRETRPHTFVGVPRIFEKIEERLRKLEATKSDEDRKVLEWAKRVGYEGTMNLLSGKPTNEEFARAKKLVFDKIREEIGFDKCEIIVVGGAPMPKTCIEYFLSYSIPILNAYGMTECTSGTTTPLGPYGVNMLSVGCAIPGTELEVKDAAGKILPCWAKGELCFRGRNKFMGYYKNEKDTLQTIDSEGFIHSGDEGMVDEKGFVFITGRFKELIITAGGENIPPILIEESLKEKCRIISNALLIGDGKKFLSMLITLKTLPNPDGSFSNQLTSEVINFVRALGVNALAVEDLIHSPQVNKYIQEVIDSVNKTAFSRAQEIRKFKILLTDFSIIGGELTETMKTKRSFIINKYRKIIDEIYVIPKL